MDYLKTIVAGLRAVLVASVAHGAISAPRAQTTDPEELAWSQARQVSTPEAYQSYLDRYPAGRYAVDAFREIVRSALPAAGPTTQQPGAAVTPSPGQTARTLY